MKSRFDYIEVCGRLVGRLDVTVPNSGKLEIYLSNLPGALDSVVDGDARAVAILHYPQLGRTSNGADSKYSPANQFPLF